MWPSRSKNCRDRKKGGSLGEVENQELAKFGCGLVTAEREESDLAPRLQA